jgi:hypothetical protein
MKAKVFFALALSALFVSSAEAIVYTVRTDSGPVTYSLHVPPGTPVGGKIKPNPQVGYSAGFPVTPGSAEVVAVCWAAGLKEKDKSDNYPNSLITLGGTIPGGFYNAASTKPTSVQRINAPVPYYLVKMRGYIAGSAQTFYAAVLDNGNIVLPVRVSRHADAPVHHSKQEASGSREKKKRKSASRVLGDRATSRAMGGAELKEGWNGSDPSN